MQVIVRYRWDSEDRERSGVIESLSTAVSPGAEHWFALLAPSKDKDGQVDGWGVAVRTSKKGPAQWAGLCKTARSREDYVDFLRDNVMDILVDGIPFWDAAAAEDGEAL